MQYSAVVGALFFRDSHEAVLFRPRNKMKGWGGERVLNQAWR